jgi:hypothetical protein
VPSQNRAAVIVFPGPSRAKEARMLVRHGYGVLMLEPRGQGNSQGDTVRWAGDRDLLGDVAYLRSRSDVDPGRIGGFGFSIGGEILLEAAAQSTAFKAVVSEGAGETCGRGRRLRRRLAARSADAGGHDGRHDRLLEPGPAAADRGSHRSDRAPFGLPHLRRPRDGRRKHEAAEVLCGRRPAETKHTGGIDVRPAEYEKRVTGFFDRTF